MKLVGLFKLPSALAATSTKTVVTAALLAGVTSAATASVVVIGSNAISPAPRHAASGQPNGGFIGGANPGTTPLIVVPKSSAAGSAKPTHTPSSSATPSTSATPSATSTPSTAAPPPHVAVIDNPGPTATPAEPSHSSSPSASPSPSASASPSSTPSTPARPHTPSPSKSPTPTPTPKPTPTPTKPSCGAFTSAQITWAAHEIGVSEGSLKSAIKAYPAATCCLPMDVANCRPGDQADLVKLAKQVEALTQKAKDSDKGKGNNHDSHDSHEGNGKSSGKNPDNNAGKNGGNHGDSDSGRGHDKSGCWHAS